MPTKQITSEQPLVEVTQANGDICYVNLQSGRQQKSHAGHTYDLDHSAIGAQDVLGRLLLQGQPMCVCPLLHQQGDGHAGVNHHEALSSLAPGLVTPRDLTRSNADRDVWLMSWLLLGFGQLRPWLGCPKPDHRHMYLPDDQGVGHLGQDTRRIGFWDLRCGGWRHDDQCRHHMQDIVLDLLCHGHNGISGSCWHIVHQLFFVFHCLASAFTRKPFGQACPCRGELVYPGLKALAVCQLHLFRRALCPQSQDLLANQSVIVINITGLLQQHIMEGFPHHCCYVCALWNYQGFACLH